MRDINHNRVLLADIGNSRIHIFDGERVIHLPHQEAIDIYGDRDVEYISVNSRLRERLKGLERWRDISEKIILKNSYPTMGVDRKALCLSHDRGLFISAGSAITVDIVENREYIGGFLLLGLKRHIESYGEISPKLTTKLNRDIDIERLPKGTRDGISYGVIAPIKAIVDKHIGDRPIYISGGDGKFLSSFFKNAIYDERLIFKGIQNSIFMLK